MRRTAVAILTAVTRGDRPRGSCHCLVGCSPLFGAKRGMEGEMWRNMIESMVKVRSVLRALSWTA